MPCFRRKDTPGWFYDIWVRGERFRGKAPFDGKREADAWLKAEKARLQTIKDDQKPIPGMPFDLAADRYWTEVGQHSKEHDLAANLDRLVEWVGHRTPISDVSNDMLARLVARRRGDIKLNAKGGVVKDKDGRPLLVSASYVNRSITQLLRRIMTRARRVWEIPLREPNWADHILEEPEERVRELSFDEEERLVEALRPDYRPIVDFAIVSGLRRRTTVDLTWSQIKWAEGEFRVKGKGDKWQTLPLTPAIVAILRPLYDARDRTIEHVFTYTAERTRTCATSGKEFVRGSRYPISYQGYATELTRACKAAGIEDFRLHDQRHTAATRTLRGSRNPAAVQKLLNHSDIKTTMKYAHVLMDDVTEAMNAAAADVAARRKKHDAARQAEVAGTPHGGPHEAKRMRTKGWKLKGNRAVD